MTVHERLLRFGDLDTKEFYAERKVMVSAYSARAHIEIINGSKWHSFFQRYRKKANYYRFTGNRATYFSVVDAWAGK